MAASCGLRTRIRCTISKVNEGTTHLHCHPPIRLYLPIDIPTWNPAHVIAYYRDDYLCGRYFHDDDFRNNASGKIVTYICMYT